MMHSWNHAMLPIGGVWTPTHSTALLEVHNPALGTAIGACPAADEADIATAVAAARHAFDHGPWPRMGMSERAAILRRAANIYRARLDPMADLITAQTGSPVAFTAQTTHPLRILDFYAALSRPVGEDRGDGVTVRREPVGVVAAIVPWNMPQKTIMMKLAPALLAGCTVVIKPAPQTPLDALALADLLNDAGLPHGVVSVVPALPAAAETLVTHPDVDKVAFTGSTATGTRLAELAAHRVARISLELGGKSAAIACPDADPTAVVASLRAETFTLSGQICSAHTRLLVPVRRHGEYARRCADLANSLRVGDPTDPLTELGPLISERQRDRVYAHIETALSEGAIMIAGASTPPSGKGWYATPTVFADVNPGMQLAQTEVFGPVLAIIPYTHLDEAVAIANGTSYGLEAAIWSQEPDAIDQLVDELRVGTVRINGAPAPIHAPLGGFKQSGIGRELGPEGLSSYLETKAIIARAG